MNMSYCRFQNTRGHLQECALILKELVGGEAEKPLSEEELRAAKRIVATCIEVAEMFTGGDATPEEVLEMVNSDADGKMWDAEDDGGIDHAV